MATIIYSARALAHLDLAFQLLRKNNPVVASATVAAIVSAVDNLALNPLIGRPIEGGLRELAISFGQTGYIALYRFVARLAEVRVLAIRHQRELRFDP